MDYKPLKQETRGGNPPRVLSINQFGLRLREQIKLGLLALGQYSQAQAAHLNRHELLYR